MPQFDLRDVKKLADEYFEGHKTVWFAAPSRSINYVVKVFHCSGKEAERIVLEGLKLLEKEDFSRSFLQWEDYLVDEYGLENYMGHNWYVKFTINNEGGAKILDEISFHPLEKSMSLSDGRTLDPTYEPKED